MKLKIIQGFLAGCAVHVMTSQIKFLLGLHGLKAYVGIGKIPLVSCFFLNKLFFVE